LSEKWWILNFSVVINSKALPWLLFSYFLALAIPFNFTVVAALSIAPTIIFEGLFYAIMREYCSLRKTLTFYTVYNLITVFQICTKSEAIPFLFMSPYLLILGPLIVLALGYADAFIFGYFMRRWLHKNNVLNRLAIRNGD